MMFLVSDVSFLLLSLIVFPKNYMIIHVGTVFMPPKWSLGYHQCRWSYDSDLRVLEIAKTFRKKGIPCDAIWMDIDYMDGFRCFTFDKVCSSPDDYYIFVTVP
ncbi:hypothetical protein IFM89_022627 [Coptis chinensis]|uniref:Glycoside hydrolase family 31 TIM barrel domain-containing protein n=1 Tax=Coptis chinensis TaxID=261450 RepID=A0A835LK79_9MAGN|nr:hypothetical protein IFM89_022627 [Coptis chinensis]